MIHEPKQRQQPRNRLVGLALIAAAVAFAIAACVPETPIPTQTPTSTATVTPSWDRWGFELGTAPSLIHIIDGMERDNILTPDGWVTWWRQGSGEGGEYGQPEVRLTFSTDPNQGYDSELPRLHSGSHGLQMFWMYRPGDGGVYSLVGGLTPGSTVRFSAWAETWTCNTDENLGYTCVPEWDQVQVAVCLGEIPNPLDAICSEWQMAADEWTRVGPVEATVPDNGVLVVFLRGWARWGFKHLDVYWDDALLVQ